MAAAHLVADTLHGTHPMMAGKEGDVATLDGCTVLTSIAAAVGGRGEHAQHVSIIRAHSLLWRYAEGEIFSAPAKSCVCRTCKFVRHFALA